MSVTLTPHACTCLDKAPLFVDGDTDGVYHTECDGYIGDVSDMALNNSFWNDQLKDRDNAVVINGVQYRVGSSVYPDKGFGSNGNHFKIKLFSDGVTYDTADLWHQGTVPEEYRRILQDNAKFAQIIEVSEFLQCPSCMQLMNRNICPFTSCPKTKFNEERIEVTRVNKVEQLYETAEQLRDEMREDGIPV